MAYAIYLGRTPGLQPLPPIPEEPALRKQVFFDYLAPVVRDQNASILQERALLLELTAQVQTGQELGWYDELRWQYLKERYRVEDSLSDTEAADLLLRRVRQIPAGLVLAQAAKESGWGRSRFARDGNALFGERCYEEGCGIVPRGRGAGARFEVESFDSVADSVASYLLNLNSHERYADLRTERERLVDAGQTVSGSALAAFTTAYSERRTAYVQDILDLIRRNQLDASG